MFSITSSPLISFPFCPKVAYVKTWQMLQYKTQSFAWVHVWKEEMTLEVRLGNKVLDTFSMIRSLAYTMLT